MDSMMWKEDLKQALAVMHLKLHDASRLNKIVSGSLGDSLGSVSLSDEWLACINE